VLSVCLALRAGEAGTTELRYPELAHALSLRAPSSPTLTDVRSAVLALRRGKSMLIERDSSGRAIQDENRRSVGSFFLNPVVSAADAQVLINRALQRGLIHEERELPRYPQATGMVKLSAAWLIERSGTRKGERHGQVGVSSRHCLALVHHGGGSTGELLELATTLQARVHNIFGIEIVPEPVQLGFETSGSVSQPE
jgi:UDP-N-acetylmuramate dehydrogenase